MSNELLLNADAVSIGSGPGGATVSRALAKNGKKVLLLEQGIDHRSRAYYAHTSERFCTVIEVACYLRRRG